MPPGGHGEGFLPPAVQAFAFIGADGERTVPHFAAGFRVLKLRANLLARRGGRPPVIRGSVNLEGSPNGPSESNDHGLQLHEAMMAGAERQSGPPFARQWRRSPSPLASTKGRVWGVRAEHALVLQPGDTAIRPS